MRIDAVHFCPLEDRLSEKRRRKQVDPSQVPQERLRLFQRTIWHRPDLAARVDYFKLPYMTRETYIADLARTVAALPNLKYADLPDGFYTADPSTQILRDELQANCHELRKMAYNAGSEQAFEALAHQGMWMSLEVLELKELDIDVGLLRIVLATLPALQELKLHELFRQDDTALQQTQNLPPFPALRKLRIENMPGITADGLEAYVSRPEVQEVLTSLWLTGTGVGVPTLHMVLGAASNLRYFSITDTVSRSFPLQRPPPINCPSLKTLNFEITFPDTLSSHPGSIRPSDSHYAYLSNSLHANGLPSLNKLYVRDPNFAETLLLQPPGPLYAGGSRPGFNQALEVYSKGPDDLDWVSTALTPESPPLGPSFAPGRQSRSSFSGRPVSAINATRGGGPQWGGGARMSVMMSNGQGGFLAVPNSAAPNGQGFGASQELPLRPSSSGGWPQVHVRHDSSKSKGDLWR